MAWRDGDVGGRCEEKSEESDSRKLHPEAIESVSGGVNRCPGEFASYDCLEVERVGTKVARRSQGTFLCDLGRKENPNTFHSESWF
jgi:hypothetical protein